MPISSRGSFDNTGHAYNVTRITNPDTTFNQEEYDAYSPLFISTTFAISYGLSFASITATLTHAFLYFRKQIWTQARRAMHEQPDIHARLMAHYPQVPEWWYAIIFGMLNLDTGSYLPLMICCQSSCSYLVSFPSKSGKPNSLCKPEQHNIKESI